jgi:hypothetical protein
MTRINPLSDSKANATAAWKPLETVNAQGATAPTHPIPGPTGGGILPAEQADIDKAVSVVNELMETVNISFKYFRDEATHISVIQVIDDSTGETIKQFPPEDIVKMIAKMYEMWGILVDEKV